MKYNSFNALNYNSSNAPVWVENAHELSLNLARAYAIAYADSPTSTQTALLFDLYKDARRAIPRNGDGSRFGSYDAYCAREGFIGV